ncbi:MAG: dihydrolipoamide acetyltransferase family protein [Steroidobacterales bacterium]
MSIFSFKMPDLGEGTVAAEIVAWHVGPGDAVTEGQTIAEVSTDKAVVEIPAPVTGRVRSLAGEAGTSIAVGAELISFDHEMAPGSTAGASPAASPSVASPPAAAPAAAKTPLPARAPAAAARIMTSPATRRRAREAGIDLQDLQGSGPGGRIRREDLDAALAAPRTADAAERVAEVEEIRVIGVRRVIAERMSAAKRNIPHFAYVEEVDVTELEALREHLGAQAAAGEPKLTLLPFVVAALARVLRDFPQCNAHYDAGREMILRYRAVHVGIATQTPDGLKVPVVRDAGQRSLFDLADEIRRVAAAARTNKATAAMLSGSTITVTSLGKLGGIASTPILNAPEVAIVGLNRMVARPVVRSGAVVVRQIMNLSSSFDHRFVDGFEAAAMIQALKGRLEHPATIFLPD